MPDPQPAPDNLNRERCFNPSYIVDFIEEEIEKFRLFWTAVSLSPLFPPETEMRRQLTVMFMKSFPVDDIEYEWIFRVLQRLCFYFHQISQAPA